jgi:hypothetical protein
LPDTAVKVGVTLEAVVLLLAIVVVVPDVYE